MKDYSAYYAHELGYHPRSIGSNGGWAIQTFTSLNNTRILRFASEIRSPVLMIHGENAHSLYFAKTAFESLTGDNKELMIIPNIRHTDLYYDLNVIPFDKIETFLKENL